MIDPITGKAIYSAGNALVGGISNYYNRKRNVRSIRAANKRLDASEAAYGKYLQGRSDKGTVDVYGRLADYRGQAMQSGREQNMRNRGEVMRRGMENSIAGIRVSNAGTRDAARMVGQEHRRLQSENEESKVAAGDAYNRFLLESQQRKATRDQQLSDAQGGLVSGTINDLAGVVNAGVGGYMDAKNDAYARSLAGMQETRTQQAHDSAMVTAGLQQDVLRKQLAKDERFTIPPDLYGRSQADFLNWMNNQQLIPEMREMLMEEYAARN